MTNSTRLHCKAKWVLLLGILSLLFFRATAQTDSLRHTISLYAGLSLIPIMVDLQTFNSIGISPNVPYLNDFASRPAVLLSYDYEINQRISLGFGASSQQFVATYMQYEYESESDTAIYSEFSETLLRNSISGRVLFHYINRNSVDLYSGLRVCGTFWVNQNGGSSRFIRNNVSQQSLAPQVILFGLRGYFTDHFGAGGELCAGPPYFLAGGLNYRF